MNHRILMADHDRGLAEATRRCLNSRGCDVAVALNGLQCMDELRSFAPNVLVLDPEILWGGGDGVLEWLANEDPLIPLVVILVEDCDRCRVLDRWHPYINERIQRPQSLHDLLPFVNQLHEIARKTRPSIEIGIATEQSVVRPVQ